MKYLESDVMCITPINPGKRYKIVYITEEDEALCDGAIHLQWPSQEMFHEATPVFSLDGGVSAQLHVVVIV